MKIDIRLWKKDTSAAALQVCTTWRVKDKSQESHLQASLTAESDMWQKPWQMQMAERKKKYSIKLYSSVWCSVF